jgi:zinc and cadmium transporter
MSLLLSIILFTLLGGVLSILAAALFLLLPEPHRSRIMPHGVSFAVGALLAVALGGLLPHAVEEVGVARVHGLLLTVLVGILAFFLLEKLMLWRHCHASDCEAHTRIEEHLHLRQPAGTLIVLGDAIHNFVDGVLIAAAFLTDAHLGIVTSLAVAAHEIPQEVGDFAILLQSGYSRARSLAYNLLASLATVAGGVLGYFSLGDLREWLPYFLAAAASSFLYIAVADLIPTLHKRPHVRETVEQMVMIVAGVLLICWIQDFAHRFGA